jgi:DNA-directed RNA polymerase specialized sigma24 family protein
MTATVIAMIKTDTSPQEPFIAVVGPAPRIVHRVRGTDPDLWLYRERTVGMLRRYLRISIEVGRLPSLLGREFFRTRVTSYRVSTFEDAVIFVHDVERSLDRLDAFERKLIGRIVLQEYTQEEAARLLQCGRRTVGRRFPEALDRLSEDFLAGGLLTRLPATDSSRRKPCQGGENPESFASCSAQKK